MLLLCVTGLPLIFHDEIDDLLHEEVKPAAAPDGTPQASLDLAIANVLAKFPGQVVHFFVWNRDDPNAFSLSINRSFDADPSTNRFVRVDAHLEHCNHCAAIYDGVRNIVALLGSEEAFKLPARLGDRRLAVRAFDDGGKQVLGRLLLPTRSAEP